MKIMLAFFEYSEGEKRNFSNDKLANACDYQLNVSKLEIEDEAKFTPLFKKYQH